MFAANTKTDQLISGLIIGSFVGLLFFTLLHVPVLIGMGLDRALWWLSLTLTWWFLPLMALFVGYNLVKWFEEASMMSEQLVIGAPRLARVVCGVLAEAAIIAVLVASGLLSGG